MSEFHFDPEITGRGLEKIVSNAVKNAAVDTTSDNANIDKDARWAIIPNPDCCPRCFMFSSNGFRYHSEASASAELHNSCQCEVVADFGENPKVADYDPAGIYERMYDVMEELGYNRADSFTVQVKGKNGKMKSVMRPDLERRLKLCDGDWLKNGTKVRTDFSLKSKEDFLRATGGKKELRLLDLLEEKHIKAMPLSEKSVLEGYKVVDAKINGIYWEFKCPEAVYNEAANNPYRFVERNIHHAAKQFDNSSEPIKGKRLIFDSRNTLGFEEKKLIEEIKHRAEKENFTEVIFVDMSESLVFIK